MVLLLTALAAHNIKLALYGDAKRADLYDEATILLNEAEKHSQSDTSLLLRKALLLLAQGKAGQAEYPLKGLASRDPDNVAAHIVLVLIVFWR